MKPIHKFNSGVGATLCNICRAIITEGLTEDLYCEKHSLMKAAQNTYIILRQDGLTKQGEDIKWIEWSEDGTYSQYHKEPAIGRSLLLDFRGITYTWMTTTIEELLEVREDYIKFRTKNSVYELFINKTNHAISTS